MTFPYIQMYVWKCQFEWCHFCDCSVIKMDNSRTFIFIFVFSIGTVYSKQVFSIKVCRWLDTKCRPLVSVVTALPTEPQLGTGENVTRANVRAFPKSFLVLNGINLASKYELLICLSFSLSLSLTTKPRARHNHSLCIYLANSHKTSLSLSLSFCLMQIYSYLRKLKSW